MSKLALSCGFLLLAIRWALPFHTATALVVPIAAARPRESLAGISLPRVIFDGDNGNDDNEDKDDATTTATATASTNQKDGALVDLGAVLDSGNNNDNNDDDERTMVVFGTHAGDFNTIEYLQKIRFSREKLTTKGGITRIICVVNGAPDQIKLLASFLDLPIEIELLADPTGEAGRSFGVDRGFRPDDAGWSPFAKQFVTGIGLGPPWGTLPAVLPGYTGSPSGTRDWIEASLQQGQLAGRWPEVLELDGDDLSSSSSSSSIKSNKFDDAPLGLSKWGRRPFELATLRLQSLIGIQIRHWSELKPVDDRCLTQLGGCTVVQNGTAIYSWVDKGLCDVPDFDDLLEAIAV